MVGCDWIQEQDWRKQEYCDDTSEDSLKVEVSCPFSCGKCPDSASNAPSMVPVTKAPSNIPVATDAPVPFVPGSSGAGNGNGQSYSPQEVTLFLAGDLYSDAKISSDSANAVMSGVNSFFGQIDSEEQGHKIFTALKEEGITGIEFSSLQLNEGITDFKALDGMFMLLF